MSWSCSRYCKTQMKSDAVFSILSEVFFRLVSLPSVIRISSLRLIIICCCLYELLSIMFLSFFEFLFMLVDSFRI